MANTPDSALSRRAVLAGMAAGAAVLSLPARAGEPDVHVIANPFPEQSPAGAALGRWKKAAEGRGEDKFKLKLKHGDEVGGQAATLEGVKSGKFAGALVTTYAMREAVPRLAALDLPYLFHFGEDKVVDDALKAARDEIKTSLELNNLKLIWLFDMGRHVVFSRTVDFSSPDNIKGQSVACRPGSLGPDTWNAVGCKAVPTPLAEIGSALTASQVEAASIEIFEGADRQWATRDRILSLTYHAVDVGFLVMNLELFNKIKSKEQEALVSDRSTQEAAITEHVRKRQGVLIDEMKSTGVKVFEPTPRNRQLMMEGTKSVHDAFLKDHGASKALYAALTSVKF
jgi:TRAP-type C4-dicarboxylate transport system substrate-binding protein